MSIFLNWYHLWQLNGINKLMWICVIDRFWGCDITAICFKPIFKTKKNCIQNCLKRSQNCDGLIRTHYNDMCTDWVAQNFTHFVLLHVFFFFFFSSLLNHKYIHHTKKIIFNHIPYIQLEQFDLLFIHYQIGYILNTLHFFPFVLYLIIFFFLLCFWIYLFYTCTHIISVNA